MKMYLMERSAVLPTATAVAPASVVEAVPFAAASCALSHQVQAELVPAQSKEVVGGVAVGFAGVGAPANEKRMDIRGVPPRGRPV